MPWNQTNINAANRLDASHGDYKANLYEDERQDEMKRIEKGNITEQLKRYRQYVLDGNYYFDKIFSRLAMRIYRGEF